MGFAVFGLLSGLGIGPGFTAAVPPAETLEVVGSILATSSLDAALFKANRAANTIPNGLQLQTNKVLQWTIGSRAGSEGLHLFSDADNATRFFVEQGTGSIGVGTTAPAASAAVELSSTTKGFLPPRMTAAQRQAIAGPAAGLVVYDTTARALMFYDGTQWQTVGAGAGVPIGTIVAWHKSATGTPALPDGWVECNGQVLNDAASPYNGQAIPNLNSAAGYTAGRFLRGYPISGIMQEGTRQLYTASNGSPGSRYQYMGHSDAGAGDWDGWFGATGEMELSPQFNPNPSWQAQPLYASRPVNMTVVWIMRVK